METNKKAVKDSKQALKDSKSEMKEVQASLDNHSLGWRTLDGRGVLTDE